MNKNKITTLLFICVVLISIITVSAHPGRTDANGGHWNRETGEYHFHTGEYAGRSSSSNSTYSEYEPFTPPYEPPTKNPYKQPNSLKASNSSYSIGEIIAIAFCSIFGILYALYIIGLVFSFIYEMFFKRFSPKYNIKIFRDKMNELSKYKIKINNCNSNLLQTKQSLRIPLEYEIGTDNLPKEKNCTDWGKSFTVYCTKNKGKIHTRYMCSGATIKKHICQFYYYSIDDLLCKKCSKNHTFPKLDWYRDYLKYNSLLKELSELKELLFVLHEEIDSCYKKCNSSFSKLLLFFNKKDKKELLLLNEEYCNIKINIADSLKRK